MAMLGAALPFVGGGKAEAMADDVWTAWHDDWKRMEATALRRGWVVEPLRIAPPASQADILHAEAAAGLPMPTQLREVLTRHSASVRFGWHVPPHLHPMERRGFPTGSFNRGHAWNLREIAEEAIPNFIGLREGSAGIDDSAAPNASQMWERQFPVFWLINGDILTIDMRDPGGAQPVRYFSHELDVLHGQALAPDFVTFVTEMAALGQAGTEWASWMRFGDWDDDRFYLRADSEGGREWRAWLDGDPAASAPNEPPSVLLGETDVERKLVTAALEGDMAALMGALVSGARPDVVWNSAWEEAAPEGADEFATPLTHCIARNDLVMAERLLAMGATLDTRRLSVAEAVTRGSRATLEWLIARGARVDGWKDERYWPLHLLVTRRSNVVAETDAELEARLAERVMKWDDYEIDPDLAAEMRKLEEAQRRKDIALRLSKADYLAMLDSLLAAGASPDAPWDNGVTMLMWGGPDTARVLLRHGADPRHRAPDGQTALHFNSSPEVARILVEAGADIDDVASPGGRKSETDPVYTPLQASLMLGDLRGVELPKTLLELGAIPSKRDGDGFPTLAYATSVPSFELMEPRGLDPLERMPDGGTLLHRLYRQRGAVRATFPAEVAILDLLLSKGIDINAQDGVGQTVLHVGAPMASEAASITLLLERGADRTIRDAESKRAVDLIPRSRTELRAALK